MLIRIRKGLPALQLSSLPRVKGDLKLRRIDWMNLALLSVYLNGNLFVQDQFNPSQMSTILITPDTRKLSKNWSSKQTTIWDESNRGRMNQIMVALLGSNLAGGQLPSPKALSTLFQASRVDFWLTEFSSTIATLKGISDRLIKTPRYVVMSISTQRDRFIFIFQP